MKMLFAALCLVQASSFAATDFFSASFPDLKGKSQAIKQWQGKPLVVNYWATWCGPCRQEMPELVELQKKYQGKVQFIGIAIDEPQAVSTFIKPLKMNYPMLIGSNSAMELMRAEGNVQGGLPFTVIYDASGKKVAVELGRIHKDKLENYFKAFKK